MTRWKLLRINIKITSALKIYHLINVVRIGDSIAAQICQCANLGLIVFRGRLNGMTTEKQGAAQYEVKRHPPNSQTEMIMSDLPRPTSP